MASSNACGWAISNEPIPWFRSWKPLRGPGPIVVVHVRYDEPPAGWILPQREGELTRVRVTRLAGVGADDEPMGTLNFEVEGAEGQGSAMPGVVALDVLPTTDGSVPARKDEAIFSEQGGQGRGIAGLPRGFIVREDASKLGRKRYRRKRQD